MIKLISFDIGGTLVKRQGTSFTTELKDLLRKYGKDPIKAYESLRVNDFSIADYCNYIGVNCEEEIRNLIKRTAEKSELYEEVREVLIQLKERYKLVTISNAVSIKNPNLSDYQIGELFDLELYSFKCGSLKPDIRMFKYIEKYCDVLGTECVHVGDTKNDIVGARRAGWKKILLCREDHSIAIGAENLDYTINNLRDLFPILKDI